MLIQLPRDYVLSTMEKKRGGGCFVDYCGYNREYREFVQ